MTGPGKSTTITMIDYGGSNLRSVQKAFEAVGARVEVTAEPGKIRRATRLVLPGVGAFKPGIDALRDQGLADATVEAAQLGVPLLGICLGMQLLFDESEEMGRHEGLRLLPGRVLKFDGSTTDVDGRPLKIPHMGWNQIDHDGNLPLLAGVAPGSHAYYVHSYYCAPEDQRDVLATTGYGLRFAAVIGRGNIFGIQFHPEKSQAIGLRILNNFANMEL